MIASSPRLAGMPAETAKDMALAVPAPGLRPVGAEPAAQSQAEPLVPSASAWVLPFDDGGERFRVSFDLGARHFSQQVTICANESGDRTLYVDHEDVRWLAAALNSAASAIEARRAETAKQGSVEDESAVAKPDAKVQP